MEVLKIRWSELGNPKEPGTIRVQGIGDVEVSQGDINRFTELGGDPWIELHDTTTFGHEMKTYLIGLFTPA